MNDTIEGTIEPSPQSTAMAIPNSPTPGDVLRLAIEQRADPNYIRELMVLQREWDADNARKSYVAAMSRFKAEPLKIEKDKRVSFTTAKGKTEYSHATIGNVVSVINAALGRHGFSHRWDTVQLDGGRITVKCTITHSDGHSESTELTASPDDSGTKNNIQAVASTISYLQRYTLLAATGMATTDQEDDDGAHAGKVRQSNDRGRAEEPQRSEEENQAASRMVTDLYSLADQGWEALSVAWKALTAQQRADVGGEFRKIKARAEAADKAKGQQS